MESIVTFLLAIVGGGIASLLYQIWQDGRNEKRMKNLFIAELAMNYNSLEYLSNLNQIRQDPSATNTSVFTRVYVFTAFFDSNSSMLSVFEEECMGPLLEIYYLLKNYQSLTNKSTLPDSLTEQEFRVLSDKQRVEVERAQGMPDVLMRKLSEVLSLVRKTGHSTG